MSYAGDVTCKECFETLQNDPSAQLIDVRTMPEWNFVGVPVLQELGKRLITVEWQQFPTMQMNMNFIAACNAALEEAGADKTSKIYCLCRSGARSISAAIALQQAGFENAFNVLGGFEGDRDTNGHRGQVSGWKSDGLPWVQG